MANSSHTLTTLEKPSLLIKGCFQTRFLSVLASWINQCSHLSGTLRWHWSRKPVNGPPTRWPAFTPLNLPQALRRDERCEDWNRDARLGLHYNQTFLITHPQIITLRSQNSLSFVLSYQFCLCLTLSQCNYTLGSYEGTQRRSLAAEMWVVSVLCYFL